MHRPLTDAERHDLAALDLLLDPLLRCDLLVIASPVWNFGAPWRLKQWIDCVAQPGKTFRYSMAGSRGLLSCRGVVLATLGGEFSDDNMLIFKQLDAFFTLLGITPAGAVHAGRLDLDPHTEGAEVVRAGADAERLGRQIFSF